MSEIKYEVFGTAKFFIEGGMYSIQEVEKMLEDMKKAKEMQDKMLRRSMGQTK